MDMPLPEIPSDVLSLLEGDFKLLQQAKQGLEKTIQTYGADLGDFRRHYWLQTLDQVNDEIRELACDECQDAPYQLGLWPIGRGHYACDQHHAILKDKGLL